MLLSIALIFLVGITFSSIMRRLRMPGLVGMLLAGMLLGPDGFNLLHPSLLAISSELRTIALIIILLKAGYTLNLKDLTKIGRPAFLMSFLPASIEILAYMLLAPLILNFSRVEGALMGTVLAAVSPAVVVPRMVKLIEKRFGTQKGIPQLILAGASLDDIFVIILFTIILGMAQGQAFDWTLLMKIPSSIILGVIVGAAMGYILYQLFQWNSRIESISNPHIKVLVILSTSFLLMALEAVTAGLYSGLLAVLSMSAMMKIKGTPHTTQRLADQFGTLWQAAEVWLFVLVGAAVDLQYLIQAGRPAMLIVLLALLFRALAVQLSLLSTSFNLKERVFCTLAYLPKATVQAAIGSVPLAMGLPSGPMILTVAVLAIITTAPMGAFAIDQSYRNCLQEDNA